MEPASLYFKVTQIISNISSEYDLIVLCFKKIVLRVCLESC